MNIADCKTLGSPTYRRLCQTLSLPPPQENVNNTGLTGYRDTDLIILSHFSDQELINVCATNKSINTLCNDDRFWMNRTIKKFSAILGDNIEQYIPEGTTWKDYYLWLSGMQNSNKKLVHELALFHHREDLLLLLGEVPPPRVNNIPHLLPFYISDNLRNFFREANLGPSDPTNPWSTPLADVIDVTILSRDAIQQLFNIYARVNNMRIPVIPRPRPPSNTVFGLDARGRHPSIRPRVRNTESHDLEATPLMLEYFANNFANTGLNPDRFRYADIQKLVQEEILFPDQLTPEQLAVLNDPITTEYLSALESYLRYVSRYYTQ